MTTINISMPEETKAFIEAEVAQEGYASASEYFLALVHEARKRKAKRELEAKLLEGLQGEMTDLTREEWEAMEREAMEGLAGESIRP
jgi:Arc/MetJ-type ribon-helix-helix transcriptional regulator